MLFSFRPLRNLYALCVKNEVKTQSPQRSRKGRRDAERAQKKVFRETMEQAEKLLVTSYQQTGYLFPRRVEQMWNKVRTS